MAENQWRQPLRLVDLGEYHSPPGSGYDADDLGLDPVSNEGFAVVDHHHGSVFQVSDRLLRVLSQGDPKDVKATQKTSGLDY